MDFKFIIQCGECPLFSCRCNFPYRKLIDFMYVHDYQFRKLIVLLYTCWHYHPILGALLAMLWSCDYPILSFWPQRNVWPSAPFYYQKIDKMKNRPPSAHKEFNSLWADGGQFFIFINFLVVKWCRRSKNENYAKKGAELFHPQFLVLRLRIIFNALRKKRAHSMKLESSQSDNDRPRNNSGKVCHQTDTLLGKMKIMQKKGRNCFTPSF